jgi:hypothetical protein
MHDAHGARDPRQYVQDHPEPGGAFDREIGLGAIVWSGVGVAVMCAVAFALLWGLVHEFRATEAKRDVPMTPLVQEGLHRQPPEPRLLAIPENDLQAMRTAEEALLHSYGWLNDEHTTVRIPVERAMDLLVKSPRFNERIKARPEPRTWTPPHTWRDRSLQTAAEVADR